MASRYSLRILIGICLGLACAAAFGQTAPNEWTWMGGSSTIPSCSIATECGQPGVYGALGEFASANIPGARDGAATWTDTSGDLWLFAGYGLDSKGAFGRLNDLWEFSPSKNQWAWIAGANTIGEAGAYGTLGASATGSIPGSRSSAATWTDGSGHFWLFGGYGFDSAANLGSLNDLWEFNPSTKEWAWMGGSNVIPNPFDPQGQPGVYGTLNTPSTQNIPGSRASASTWVDKSGNFWLFGGVGDDLIGNENALDDLWEFNPATREWTWRSGADEIPVENPSGVYGTLGVPDAANHPGNRSGAVSWADSNGNLWLFGGLGYDEFAAPATLNDVWEFSPSTNEWTWMGGGSTENSSFTYNPGVYGTLGTFAEGNIPSGRSDAIGWIDKSGKFWLFGGSVDGTSIYQDQGYLNDVWEFDPSKNQWAWMGETIAACSTCIQPGVYGTLGTPNAANTPGARILPVGWTDPSGHFWLFGGGGLDKTGNYGYLNDLWEYAPYAGTRPATTTPTVTVSPSPSSITSAQALTVTVSVSGGSGKSAPTGSVTLISREYTSAATALSGGSATITVPANSLLAAVDTLTAYYAPDAASVSIYNGASGSASIDVASPVAITAAIVYVSPLEYGFWTTESMPVTVSVFGGGATQVPTGSVVIRAGSYTSAPTVLGAGLDSGGYAHLEIPGGSLPAGTDMLTVTYTPDAGSSETFSVSSGSASVVVSVQPLNGLDWTWMGGDNILPGDNDQYGVYGTLGVPSVSNYPGGRTDFASWTDSSGNFWLFGGGGNDAIAHGADMNDLWKFNPTTMEWTWVSGSSHDISNYGGGYNGLAVYGTLGVFASGNVPGGRSDASSWVDAAGHFWLFGGYGFDANNMSGPLNDLWEFDPSNTEWAWISGSSTVVGQQYGQPGVYGTLGLAASGNVPSARQYGTSWIDKSGNLWLFGGYPQDPAPDDSGCVASDLNDVWMFNPSTKLWAWMGGSIPASTGGYCGDGEPPVAGVYGKLGTPAAGNIPGGRDSSATWTDSSGNFWLFGGGIISNSYGVGSYNDLWEFNPATNQWTWMGGSNTIVTYTHGNSSSSDGQAGVYGTLGTPAASNIPGSRGGSFTWTDNKGNYWLLGGAGLDSNGVPGELNDLWELNFSTKQWTWMGGVSTLPPIFAYPGPPGIYGTLGVPASANTPGGRSYGASWTDKSGHLWLFGGYSWDAVGQNGWFNDLWEYRPAILTSAITPTVTVTPSAGTITTAQALSVTVAVSGGSGNPTPTGSVTLSSGTYNSTAVTLTSGSATINVPAGSLATGTDTLNVTYTPDSASSSTYDAASGSNTVTVSEAKSSPTVTVTPAPSSVTAAQTLSVKVTVSGGSGNPTPTGSVTLSSGSYTSAAVTLSGGGATISVPASSLAIGTDTLTVTYTPDSSSSSTYNTATGTNKVTVTAASSGKNEWAWMGGSDVVGSGEGVPGVYGTLGKPAATNIPGGRYLASTWVDSSGNFWLFGGAGDDANNSIGNLNDLWEFDPSSDEWTWMSGSSSISSAFGQPGVYGTRGTPAAGNIPGGRYGSASWTDKSGNFWLFGGNGSDSAGTVGQLNDLWEFNPSTKDWTWVAGLSTIVTGVGDPGVYGTLGNASAANLPGGRESASAWTDSNGNFWLFGGQGYDSGNNFGYLNDLWEFNPSTKEWTWIAGSSTEGSAGGRDGVYGTLGTAAAGNTPGSRYQAAGWIDSGGDLWLFGGTGQDSAGSFGDLNDLWEFNSSTKEWTWMGGSATLASGNGRPGVYGTQGVPAATNIPGGRSGASAWTGSGGHFWLFGGDGYDGNGILDTLNDLWDFNSSTNTWTWMGGTDKVNSNTEEVPGVYGTLGVFAPGNVPGGREQAANWIDSSGHFWLLGGQAFDSVGNFGNLNDVWEYEPSLAPAPIVTVSPSSSSITSAQALPVTITVGGGTGNPTPTGTVTLSSGSYASAATTLSGGSANITIPAGSLAVGTDTLTASYIPDSASAATYSPATGSNTVAVTTPAKITPTLTVTPSPSSITTAQALSVKVTVSGGSGNPTPTGSATLTSGSYTSAAVTLISGSGTINIPAGSLATGTDTVTVAYTPNSASSSTYNSATGSNTVTVTTPAKTTPTLTVTPSPTSITTTQVLSVKVTVSGGSGNPTPTGSVTLTSGTYASAATTLSTGSATINMPAGSLGAGTDTLAASYTPDSASLSTYNSASGSNTVTVTNTTVQVTVGTTPAGLSFSVDGTSYTTKQTLTWTVGASHTIATTSPQISAGTQNTFASWSDGEALSHSVTAPSSATSYTATFTTSYQLTTATSPSADGTVTPASGSYYTSGAVVNLTATPESGFKFASWTGSVASASSASTTVTMSAPQSVTANFIVATAPVATLSPPLSFTSTVVGTTSSALAATLSNSGNATLNISSIAIGGGNPTDFTVTTGANACEATLAADASCSIYVTFTPASAAGFSATLNVTDNATPATQSITLTGIGTPTPAPIASLTPAMLSFTAVSGTTSAAQMATLSNTGNATLNITNIAIAGGNPSDFAETNTCGETLNVRSNCTISITFTPASAASFSATLQIADNASGSPQSTTLSGTGTPPPSFTISSNSGAQTIPSGGTATYTITVTPQNGAFTNAVAFSATGLPTGATGSFAPASVTLGSASATSTLSIQTATRTVLARPSSAWSLAAPALALVSLLFLPGKRRRRWLTLGVLFFASLGVLTALSACGGGFALNRQAQSYTITVTGTSGADVQSTTVQLTVQ